MKYSITIISKNNRCMLENCLAKLDKYIPSDTEIVVVEALSASAPPLPARVKHIVLPPEKAGFATQRNEAVSAASGDYVIFVDDDVEITEGWFERLTSAVEENPGVTGAMGAVFPKDAGFMGFTAAVFGHPGGGFRLHNFSNGAIIPLSEVATCNTAMKKSDILTVGGFDTLCDRFSGEDTDLCDRIIDKFGPDMFRYVPAARVWHYTANKITRVARWYFRRGHADAYLAMRHKRQMKYLLRSSITLKLTAAFLLWALFGFTAFLAAAAVWYLSQLFRARFMFRYFGVYGFSTVKKAAVFLLYPLNKFLVHLAIDAGRLAAVLKL
ncbi:MAG: glycosyltransferase [Endomicrobiia bacterium]|nr:glycosyltransferase [Endomicrobiia bacterium]